MSKVKAQEAVMKHGDTVTVQDFMMANKVIKARGCKHACALIRAKRDTGEWVVGYIWVVADKLAFYREVTRFYVNGWERGELEAYIRGQVREYERVCIETGGVN